ncbi:MAG: restriction endonuclease subunit S [Thermodesulfobacteriota bacterium]
MTTTQEQTVPTLRFPEFIGEWDSLKLGDVAVFSKGKGISKADIEEDGAIECIRYGQLYTDYAETIRDVKSRTNIPLKDLVLSEANDIIVPASGETQLDIATASCVLKSDIALGGDLNIIKTKHDGVFLSYYLNSKRKLDIARLSQGISVVHLYAAQLKLLHLNLPGDTEQQKIASFLTSVDTKIEQLGKKKTLLEHYKKGMMQKLFSQGLRFKDEHGNDFPDWESRPFGDFYEFKSTNSFSRDKLNYEAGQVRNIHYGDIHTKFKPGFELSREVVPFINPDIDLDNISEDKFCKEGDLVIADASEDYADIGKTIEIISLNGEKVLAGLHTLLARRLDKEIYIGYGAYMMRSEYVRKQIKLIAQGIKVLSISTGRMRKIKIPIPSPDEQQKIADFLSAIDKKIELIATELNQAQTFKKGLLQQMFI